MKVSFLQLSDMMVIVHLSMARDEIETGEPWYQPQGYAIAAQKDCDKAAAAIKESGLTDFTVALAVAAIVEASKGAASTSTEKMVYSWASHIHRLWHESMEAVTS